MSNDMRQKFASVLQDSHYKLMTREKYLKTISIMKDINEGKTRDAIGGGCNIAHYKKKYHILNINGSEKLIHPCQENGIKQYIESESLYDVLFEAHINTGRIYICCSQSWQPKYPPKKTPKKKPQKKPPKVFFFYFKGNRYILYLIPSFLYQKSHLLSFKYKDLFSPQCCCLIRHFSSLFL